MLYRVHLSWVGLELTMLVRVVVFNATFHNSSVISWRDTTLVVIGTDCVGSCKSNYHTITTTTTHDNQTVRHDITEILLKVALNIITLTPHVQVVPLVHFLPKTFKLFCFLILFYLISTFLYWHLDYSVFKCVWKRNQIPKVITRCQMQRSGIWCVRDTRKAPYPRRWYEKSVLVI
jgi:hypothetical protein